jgi:hypothetical protein
VHGEAHTDFRSIKKMVEHKEDLDLIKNCMDYLHYSLKRLAGTYYEQKASIEDFARWNLANDIVSDWDNYEQVVNFLFESKLIDEGLLSEIHNLVVKFDEASPGNSQYDENIWTLEGVKDHPFWKKQRGLAKEILEELEKIKIN